MKQCSCYVIALYVKQHMAAGRPNVGMKENYHGAFNLNPSMLQLLKHAVLDCEMKVNWTTWFVTE